MPQSNESAALHSRRIIQLIASHNEQARQRARELLGVEELDVADVLEAWEQEDALFHGLLRRDGPMTAALTVSHVASAMLDLGLGAEEIDYSDPPALNAQSVMDALSSLLVKGGETALEILEDYAYPRAALLRWIRRPHEFVRIPEVNRQEWPAFFRGVDAMYRILGHAGPDWGAVAEELLPAPVADGSTDLIYRNYLRAETELVRRIGRLGYAPSQLFGDLFDSLVKPGQDHPALRKNWEVNFILGQADMLENIHFDITGERLLRKRVPSRALEIERVCEVIVDRLGRKVRFIQDRLRREGLSGDAIERVMWQDLEEDRKFNRWGWLSFQRGHVEALREAYEDVTGQDLIGLGHYA